MPQDAAYRKYTEQLVNERFGHVEAVSDRLRCVTIDSVYTCDFGYDETCLSSQETDVDTLEKKINCGQIEEVIFQFMFMFLRPNFLFVRAK
ncbi:hypothetical protein F2P81_018628 [Scophthalmus maximus]|uniref:Uncharacterized protein n=1 Tax=Scophthalmus maximus TaxID=52904 RepID=A0A6A4S580_SCOMX|nr:hypothetical protein F2P81_018628 [Scophthalmus maximus]